MSARDCAREPPSGRWLLPLEDVYEAGGPQPDKVYSKRACFVDDFQSDLSGLNIDQDELTSLDPMSHLILHAAAQAWRDSVTDRLDLQKVGLVIGNIALPSDSASKLADELILPVFEKQLGLNNPSDTEVNELNRFVAGLPAGILARALGIGGGSYTLDAACASSLYSLKYAVDELQSGRRDAMLCGGLSRPDSLYTQMGFSALHAISASGRCSPFDAKGDGLVVGEGAGILVLKRLQDALDDGDDIYATIAGIGLSNDIEGNLMSPDTEGQLRAMRAAYKMAGWQPNEVDLIECHGTGTPVGDGVEFNSLLNLWGESKNSSDCVIGSVKSNIGHLLTAAGAAGLIKVLLAMKQEKLPPTANFESASVELESSPFTVLSEALPWQRRSTIIPRRAAISAFGFGGINAHVLLEQWDGTAASGTSAAVGVEQRSDAIAIVGMDACFGSWKSLTDFRQRVFGFDSAHQAQELKNNWGRTETVKGFAVGEVEIPLGRFRIPPKELKELLPQQLLMLQVAANAIDDAGEAEKLFLKNAGVYIGIGLDLSTTNFHLRWNMLLKARQWSRQLGLDLTEAELRDWVEQLRELSWPAMNANRTMGGLGGIVASRIARAFSVGGPSFTLSSEESSGLRALDTAVGALRRGEISSAIVGAVDLASDIRALAGVDEKHIVGEGAAALILKREQDALRDGDRIYTLIKGVGIADQDELALQRALQEAKTEVDSLGLMMLHGGNPDTSPAAEEAALVQLFKARKNKIPCALSGVNDDIGHTGAAAGMVALVKTSLCLYHRIVPESQLPDSAFSQAEKSSTLFKPKATQYWLRDRDRGPRQALLNSKSTEGNSLIAVLEEAGNQDLEIHTLETANRESLFSLCASNKYELIDAIQRLRALAADVQSGDLSELARQWWQLESTRQDKELALSIISESIDELAALLKKAQSSVDADEAISTDKVFYSPKPRFKDAKLAFVFPGSGSHFIGMGREMSARWPAVLENLDKENQKLATQFATSRFWTKEETRDFSHEDFIFGQVWLGTMVSDVIASFSVKPDAIIGYCLGETVGLFATRTWADRDLMLERMQATPLFTRDLGGSCDAVKQSWGLSQEDRVDWQLGVLDRNADEVREALSGRSRVYLLIINTPNECIIGGERCEVEKLVQDLHCAYHPLEGVTTVHCEVVKPVEKAYRDLHLFETTPPEGVSFYSGIAGSQYGVNTESAADSITRQALETFNYTRLINTAWDDGVRIFIEMGPGASCSRMIGQILGGREHIARSACVNGQSDVGNVLRILAQLNTEGVPLDLSSLYAQPEVVNSYSENEKIAVQVGKHAFIVPLPETDQRKETEMPVDGTQADVLIHPASASQTQGLTEIIEQMAATEVVKAEVEEAFLRVANGINTSLSQAISTQMQLLQSLPGGSSQTTGLASVVTAAQKPAAAFDRDMCMEFAIGSVAKILGPVFSEVDSFPSRVRLPDEPLMLVDRIIKVEGEMASMTQGRVVTEHDVHAGAWYLDAGRIPTCIAVEAGQADLFLSGYLGIDLQTRGLAVYRLLDAEVCFHGPLPKAGQVIHYDIYIDHFFRQGDTWLFRFGFDGSVDGQPLITMRNGCTGFFTQAELDAGRGIVLTTLEQQAQPGKCAADWQSPLAMQKESFSDAQIDALRAGDLAACFGERFAALPLQKPMGLPGGKMTLVHRILSLDPQAGRFGLGMITGEADIHEDDWFITCHFVDDQVMPGTLMYECCLHTLRVYLLRMGWVGEADEFVYEPIIDITSKLKCRGQVLASTKKVEYEISIKEIGYSESDGTPYVIADALMSADGRAIVQMGNMSLRLSGLTKERIESIWTGAEQESAGELKQRVEPLFDYASINAFAVGKPSDAFGDRYKIFDEQRTIARLPGPPFQFLDRIISIRDCEQWQLNAGALIEGQYDVPADAWYFAADRQTHMPFSVLLEISLQPCGWLAAYLGSALTSDIELSFRNLGGQARQLRRVDTGSATLTIKVKMTNVSLSGGMIIQNYDFEVRDQQGVVYAGDTYFGFFSKAALADQVGIREVELYEPSPDEKARATSFGYPEQAPFPDAQMRMVHNIDCFAPDGGPEGLGFIRGSASVNEDAWFFKAHFYQDPVWPGSLGLESFMQLLKVAAMQRWSGDERTEFECMALDQAHNWLYRGQIIPRDEKVTVQACITEVDDEQQILHADGFLSVDGRIIYQMTDFALKMLKS